jgi:uncharacterized membrane protein YjgN (DUF898 family)
MMQPIMSEAQYGSEQVKIPAQTRVHRFVFTGSAAEYFRIWIVNVFLTIITLGIYSAWAKVRSRQYFYANTRLAGQAFEYLGEPLPILKGNIMVGVLFLVYSLVTNLAPLWAGLAGLVVAVAFPYLIFQSVRFLAHNSSYRNIRFRFHGNLMDSYIHYALLPLLTVPTLGLALPYVTFRQRHWIFNNVSFGTLRNQFHGLSGAFYTAYGTALGLGLLVLIPVAVVGGGWVGGVLRGGGLDTSSSRFYLLVALLYGLFFLITSLLQQYIYCRTVNYVLNQSLAGGFVRFSSRLSARALIWIRFSNVVAIVFSLGLLSPWAKVRHVQYLLSSISLISNGDLDGITADLSLQNNNAIGDAATDFFNVDVGL